MESSACRRRASYAEQSAWSYSYSVTAEREPVKEEPEWGECDVSEAAVAEGLYADHDVKEELVIGPELVQQQDIAFSMQNVLPIIEENLQQPKPAGGDDAAPECSHTCPEDGRCDYTSIKQQYGLRRCFVRLQRLTIEDPQMSKPFHKSCDRILSLNLAPGELKSVHCGVENSGTRKLPANCQTCNMEHQHIPKLYSYNTCTSYAQQSNLISPLRVYTCEKRYSCDVCNKRFTKRFNLTNHIRIHTGEKPYGCDVCNKRFTRQNNLTRHIPIHTGEKPYSCDVCNKRFTQKIELTTHIRIHTGEKPYSCDLCNKRFTQRVTLTSHIRIHTGEKRYSCNVCNKWFTQRAHLTRHIPIHTGVKPYGCDVCNKRFTQQNSLTRHIQIHTGEKQYSCDICDKRFTDKSNLRRHIQRHKG